MVFLLAVLVLWLFGESVAALRYDQNYVGYNLNENKEAVDPLEYSGIWKDHTFQPSPKNWRFPFYTIFLDKFVNGDPMNDDINGTAFEHDAMYFQLSSFAISLAKANSYLIGKRSFAMGETFKASSIAWTISKGWALKAYTLREARSSIHLGTRTRIHPSILRCWINILETSECGGLQSQRYIVGECTVSQISQAIEERHC
jgi:hypothetical protein